MSDRPFVSLAVVNLLALLLTTLAACGESSQLRITPLPEMACDIPVTPVSLLGMQGNGEERYFVVEDENEWCALWAELEYRLGPPLPCDTSLVNFSSEVALVAATGRRGSGGYSVTIPCVQTTDVPGEIEVFIIEQVPGDGCASSLLPTAPIGIARVPRPVTSATFHRSTHQHDCD